MKKFYERGFVVLAGLLIIFLAGCGPVAETSSNQASQQEFAQSLISNALKIGVAFLQNQGVQQVAIAAAQSYIAQNVENEEQASLYNQAIQSAIPALANALASSQKEKSLVPGQKFEDSVKFREIANQTYMKYQSLNK